MLAVMSATRLLSPPRSTRPPQSRLLAGLPDDGSAVTLQAHRVIYPRPPAARPAPWPELIDEVGRAGLRGRGGAGFPTARKLRSVAEGKRRPIVVANGTEGEPNSSKDRLLLTRLPHLVLDGALWAAAAVGADEVAVGVDRTDSEAVGALRRAIDERARTEPTTIRMGVAETPPRYVAGEETALVHWLNGGPAKPTATPPRPFQQGVDRRPTLVQNVETLAHLAQIGVWGSEWFRQSGTADEPGTALFTVSGAVNRPSVVEAAIGTPVADILALAGGPSAPLQALLVGGFFGTWVPVADALSVPCSLAGLQSLGAAPGAGIVVALPAAACGLTETARVIAWYAAESAGQCGPCLYGLADLAAGSGAVGSATTKPDELGRLRRWAEQIEGRGGCRHPDGAVRLLRSALRVFAADLNQHLSGTPCAGALGLPTLHVPRPSTMWR
jgi:NADH:ubiquinone oxidoreductase subunit F (NADH-binding)